MRRGPRRHQFHRRDFTLSTSDVSLTGLAAGPSRGDSVGGAARKRSKCLHME
jgi:hypothetical protein